MVRRDGRRARCRRPGEDTEGFEPWPFPSTTEAPGSATGALPRLRAPSGRPLRGARSRVHAAASRILLGAETPFRRDLPRETGEEGYRPRCGHRPSWGSRASAPVGAYKASEGSPEEPSGTDQRPRQFPQVLVAGVLSCRPIYPERPGARRAATDGKGGGFPGKPSASGPVDGRRVETQTRQSEGRGREDPALRYGYILTALRARAREPRGPPGLPLT